MVARGGVWGAMVIESNHVDPIFCRYEIMYKSRATQIPPGKHVHKSRIVQIPPGKDDVDRADHTTQRRTCPEISRSRKCVSDLFGVNHPTVGFVNFGPSVCDRLSSSRVELLAIFFSCFCFILFNMPALFSPSLPVVTQTRGHIAGSLPPSPLRYVFSFLSREEFSVFFPGRLASIVIGLYHNFSGIFVLVLVLLVNST